MVANWSHDATDCGLAIVRIRMPANYSLNTPAIGSGDARHACLLLRVHECGVQARFAEDVHLNEHGRMS